MSMVFRFYLTVGLMVAWQFIAVTSIQAQPGSSSQQEGEALGPKQAYYVATLAAAAKSLRLNEVADANRWLNAAPQKFRGWEWSFLHSHLDESERTTRLETDSPGSIAVSSNGKCIATADANGKIQLRTATDHEVVRELGNHTGAVYSIAFSPDSERLVSVSRDVTARVWDLKSGKELSRISLDNPGVAATTFSPDGKRVATCSWCFEGEPKSVYGIVWIWNAADGKVLHRKRVGIKPLDSIAWSKDSKTIAVGSWDGLVHILDDQANEKRVLRMPDEGLYNAVSSVALNPKSTQVAAGSKDRTVRIWDLETGKLVHTLRDHGGFVNHLAFSPKENWIATACEDSIMRVWDLSAKRLLPNRLLGHHRSVTGMAWQDGGDRIISVSKDQTLRQWVARKSYGSRLTIETAEEGTYAATFSPDGSILYVATHRGHVVTIDSTTGKALGEFEAHRDSTCNYLSIDKTGKWMVTCSWDKTAKIWSLAKNKLRHTLDAGGGVYHCQISPNGRWCALAVGKVAQLWDVRSGKKVGELKGHSKSVRALAFDPSSTQLATSSDDERVLIWDLENLKPIQRLPGHQGGGKAVTYAADGKRIATGDGVGKVRTWRVNDGKLLHTVQASDRTIWRLDFSPDGNRLAAASQGVSIIAAEIRQPLLRFYPVPDSVWSVEFSPDGNRLAVCDTGGRITICHANRSQTNAKTKK